MLQTLTCTFEPRLSSVTQGSGDLRALGRPRVILRLKDSRRSETNLFRIHRLIYIQLFINRRDVFDLSSKALGKWYSSVFFSIPVVTFFMFNTGTATPLSNPAVATSSSQPPALPLRPSSSNANSNHSATRYPHGTTQPYRSAQPYRTAQPFGTASRINSTPYGGIGGYTRYGGINNAMYGGGYGSMFGGIGGMPMYGGMGGPGMMGVDPNDPNSLTNSFNQNTQATFQMIEGIVGAFGGLAQMLESTYMATHSSFFGRRASFRQEFHN